jgi:hypothetical protein
MTWRGSVQRNPLVDGISITLVQRLPGGTAMGLGVTTRMEPLPEASMPPPSFHISDAVGRLLLDLLAEHYGNTSGGRQTRADFEHARARQDHLTDAVIDLARNAMAPPTVVTNVREAHP